MTGSSAGRGEQPLPEFDGLAYMSTVLPHLRDSVQPRLLPGWEIVDGRICSVRNRTYGDEKRGKSSALFHYDLSLRQECNGGRARRSELYLKAFLNGRGTGISVDEDILAPIPELDAYAWVFPGDPTIRSLPTMADPERVEAHLPYAALGRLINGPGDVHRVHVERLRYKPEDRCSLRVIVHGHDTAPRALIAKVFSSADRAVQLFETANVLWERSKRRETSFVVPEPLALDRDNATLWISELTGESPTRATLDAATVSRIAAAMVSFHRCHPVAGAPPRTARDQLAETAARAGGLSELFPQLAPRLTELVDRLDNDAAGLEIAEPRNLHGAFRMRQLIIDDADVGLIDFDSLANGDPLEDIVDVLLDFHGGSPDEAPTRLTTLFLAEYQRISGEELDRDRLRWQVPVQLLKRAYWLRHAGQRRPIVAAELARRVGRACDPDEAARLEAGG